MGGHKVGAILKAVYFHTRYCTMYDFPQATASTTKQFQLVTIDTSFSCVNCSPGRGRHGAASCGNALQRTSHRLTHPGTFYAKLGTRHLQNLHACCARTLPYLGAVFFVCKWRDIQGAATAVDTNALLMCVLVETNCALVTVGATKTESKRSTRSS